ncbi:MAG: hypothetical protein LBR13_05455, partial [Dysgonamonadaceae bacterium]|nr:hypothetical protein [Dysgonamonadaceae bacterium]
MPKFILPLFSILLLSACSTTKYIPDGQYLLDDVSLKTDSNIISKTSLAEYIQQKPNSPKFGLMLYNLVKSD